MKKKKRGYQFENVEVCLKQKGTTGSREGRFFATYISRYLSGITVLKTKGVTFPIRSQEHVMLN